MRHVRFRETFEMNQEQTKEYWRRNIRIVMIMLVIWFLVSYGAGLIFAPALNRIEIAGFRLGFWFAQQGAIYIFVAMVFVYAALMNRLDKEFDVHEGD